jgi:hypothetical protein
LRFKILKSDFIDVSMSSEHFKKDSDIGPIKKISEVEKKPFMSSLNIHPEACYRGVTFLFLATILFPS